MTRTASRRCCSADDAPAEHDVWMSHFDGITEAPDGFTVTATTPGAPVAVLENDERRIYGVQFHPEVVHSPHGMAVLARFLHDLAGIATPTGDVVGDRRAGRPDPRAGRRPPA